MRLFNELKRRNVIRVAVAYGVVAWFAIQLSEIVFPRFGFPDWTTTFVIVVALIGLPLALVLAWAYELTPDRIRPGSEVETDVAMLAPRGRRPLDRVIVLGLIAVIALLVAERVWLANRERTAVLLPAESEADGAAPASQSTATPNATGESAPSLVVLPFANLSADPANVYFADSPERDRIARGRTTNRLWSNLQRGPV
jgi:hypothetical protein